MLTLFKRRGVGTLAHKAATAAKLALGSVGSVMAAKKLDRSLPRGYRSLVRSTARLAKSAARSALRKRKGNRKKKSIANKKIRRIVTKELDKGKATGKYRKTLVSYGYRNSFGNVDNSQGYNEFYSFQPKELLDAISVMFNGKTAAADFTTATNNFSGDPDFTLSARVVISIENTSQVMQKFKIYSVEPSQDSDTSFNNRWNAALDEVSGTAGSITNRQWDIHPTDGSKELGRYWKGIAKPTYIHLAPGQSVIVDTHILPRLGINWEDMKYQGSVITYKKGITKGTIIVQQNPLMHSTTAGGSNGNFIGAPTGYLAGYIVKREFLFRGLCPDQATEASNVDKLVYFNNLSASIDTAAQKMGCQPATANIATVTQ